MSNDFNKLELRVLVDADEPNRPNIQVLIDGEELFSPDRYLGYDPEDLLSTNSPLFAELPPRRVALYLCTCGEPGCASIAPLIEQKGDRIVWSDFRNYVGVYTRPTDEPYPDTSWGRPIDRSDLEFSVDQYEGELRRAIEDRSWETDQRAVSRLVRTMLDQRPGQLEVLGVKLEWAFPGDEDHTSLAFRRGEEQLVLEYTTSGLGPEAAAAHIVESLLSTDVTEWPITWSSGDPFPH